MKNLVFEGFCKTGPQTFLGLWGSVCITVPCLSQRVAWFSMLFNEFVVTVTFSL